MPPVHGPFSGADGRYLVLLLAAGAAALATVALLLIFGRGDGSLEGRLGMYAEPTPGAPAAPGDSDGSLVETGLVQKAVDLTSKVAGDAGVLDKVEALLEQANLPLRPAEALFFYGAGVLLVGLLAVLGAPSLPVGVAAAGLVAAGPVVVLRGLRARRLKAFEAQLPDTLNLLAGSLRAGYSFLQCVEAVSQETTDPMAR